MQKKSNIFLLLVFAVLFAANCYGNDGNDIPLFQLNAQDRILVLAPHPDDEVLGCAGVVQKALSMKLPVRVVFFTYGDNNEWSFFVYRKRFILLPKSVLEMGLLRHDEAINAGITLGLSMEQLVFLGYPDFGTFRIWCGHWNNEPPLRSMLTKVTAVPYANAFRPGASYKGEEIVTDLITQIRQFKPTRIFVSHPADNNPDHRALYLFTRIALWNLESEMHPEILPFIIHYKRWPEPRGLRPTDSLKEPTSLKNQIDWKTFPLSTDETNRKLKALQSHKTQLAYSSKYLLSFIKTNELFGDFPDIDLQAPSSQSPPPIEEGEEEEHSQPPEELTDLEQAAFIGLEWHVVKLENDKIVLSIKLTRPLAETVQASIYIFGYRYDTPYELMPKIHIQLGPIGYGIYDQTKKLAQSIIQVDRQPKELSFHIPLQVLGNPDKILTSGRTYLGNIPLDWVSWRILNIRKAEKKDL